MREKSTAAAGSFRRELSPKRRAYIARSEGLCARWAYELEPSLLAAFQMHQFSGPFLRRREPAPLFAPGLQREHNRIGIQPCGCQHIFISDGPLDIPLTLDDAICLKPPKARGQ